MKKLIILFCLLSFGTSLFAQVSSYPKILKKQNFKDSTYFTKSVSTVYGDLKNAQIGLYNAFDYGAVGDSITDDTQAIKDAVAVVGLTGGTVFFPIGKYKITSQILIEKPINLKGVPVMDYTTAAGFTYKSGSTLYSSGSAMAMILIKSATSGGNGDHL